MTINFPNIEATRADLRQRRQRFYKVYAARQALMDDKIEANPDALFHRDAETQRAVDLQNGLLEELIEHATKLVDQFNAEPGSEAFHYLIERDPILESIFGVSPIQLAVKSGTLQRRVMVTTADARKLEWTGLFLASGQFVGLENHDAEELRSPRERELENEGFYVDCAIDIQLIQNGELIDGTRTDDGLFFPIDGPLAFLNPHRMAGK